MSMIIFHLTRFILFTKLNGKFSLQARRVARSSSVKQRGECPKTSERESRVGGVKCANSTESCVEGRLTVYDFFLAAWQRSRPWPSSSRTTSFFFPPTVTFPGPRTSPEPQRLLTITPNSATVLGASDAGQCGRQPRVHLRLMTRKSPCRGHGPADPAAANPPAVAPAAPAGLQESGISPPTCLQRRAVGLRTVNLVMRFGRTSPSPHTSIRTVSPPPVLDASDASFASTCRSPLHLPGNSGRHAEAIACTTPATSPAPISPLPVRRPITGWGCRSFRGPAGRRHERANSVINQTTGTRRKNSRLRLQRLLPGQTTHACGPPATKRGSDQLGDSTS